MRIKRLQQFRIIEADDAATFQSELNKALAELADLDPEIDTDVRAGFRAFIRYEKSEDIPETLAEQFNVRGISYKCKDCPECSFIRTRTGEIDARQSRGICPHTEYGHCFLDAEACELFYSKLIEEGIKNVK